jgi:hypothetical protein
LNWKKNNELKKGRKKHMILDILGAIIGGGIIIILVTLLAPIFILVLMIPLLKKLFIMKEEARGEAFARGFQKNKRRRY